MTKLELREFFKQQLQIVSETGLTVIRNLPDRKDGLEWNEIDILGLLRKLISLDRPSVKSLIKIMLLSDREHYPGENQKPVLLTQEERDFNERVKNKAECGVCRGLGYITFAQSPFQPGDNLTTKPCPKCCNETPEQGIDDPEHFVCNDH